MKLALLSLFAVGAVGAPGLLQQAIGADGSWERLIPAPPQAYTHTGVYDQLRHRMIVFGGTHNGVPCISTNAGDTYALTLGADVEWSGILTEGPAPGHRQNASAIYDPIRDRMIIFGGIGYGGLLSDAWDLSLSGVPSWNQIVASGTQPPNRYRHCAIYDPVRDRMIVFGYASTMYVLALSGPPEWSALSTTGPAPPSLKDATAVYDQVRDRMLVFGGAVTGTGNDVTNNNVWALTLSGPPTWTQLSIPGPLPTPRERHTAIYDPVRDRMVVCGGYYSYPTGTMQLTDAWALDLVSQTWEELPSVDWLTSMVDQAAVYDPVADRMVVFGGQVTPSTAWQLPLGAEEPWSALIDTRAPLPQTEATLVCCAAQDRMVLFGGRRGSTPLGDAFALAYEGPLAWSALGSGSPGPSPRYGQAATYDAQHHRVIVFGGFDGSYRADVWALDPTGEGTWSAIVPPNAGPDGRAYHTMVYDAARDRVVVFGGYNGSYLNDAWALELSGSMRWKELTPSGSLPSPRGGHVAVANPACDEMVIFGGGSTGPLNDAWSLSFGGGGAWVRLNPPGTPPASRLRPAAGFDATRGRLVFYGGEGPGGDLSDAWALTLCPDSPQWVQLAPSGTVPQARSGMPGAYDTFRDRLVFFGGTETVCGPPTYLTETWCLNMGSSIAAVAAGDETGSLLRIAPNPTARDLRMSFSVPFESIVRLTVYDVSGREVAVLVDGKLAPGAHTATWHPRAAVGPGVYFVRYAAAGLRDIQRVVVVR